jgi:hypothetical protein
MEGGPCREEARREGRPLFYLLIQNHIQELDKIANNQQPKFLLFFQENT